MYLCESEGRCPSCEPDTLGHWGPPIEVLQHLCNTRNIVDSPLGHHSLQRKTLESRARSSTQSWSLRSMRTRKRGH